MIRAQPERVRSLDVIRGIAVFLVVTFHCYLFQSMRIQEAPASSFWHSLQMSSWIGVDIFFVLSGFLITGILARSQMSSPDSKSKQVFKFQLRRALRIWPLYILFLVGWICARGILPDGLGTSSPLSDLMIWTQSVNFGIGLFGWQSVPLPLHHLWSLALEEQFYLVWPILFFGLSAKNFRRALWLFVIAAPVARWAMWISSESLGAYMWPMGRLDSFAWGAIAFLYGTSVFEMSKMLRRICIVVGLVIPMLGLTAISALEDGFQGEAPLMLIAGLSCLGIFVASILILSQRISHGVGLTRPKLSVLLNLTANILSWMGRRCFAIYLFHQPVIIACLFLFETESFAFVRDYLNGPLETHALPIGISLLLAEISWWAFELPILKLRDRWFVTVPLSSPDAKYEEISTRIA